MIRDDPDAVRRWLAASELPAPSAVRSPPGWPAGLVGALGSVAPEQVSRNDTPPADDVAADHPAVEPSPRQAAVLVLLGDGPQGTDVLLQRRSEDLRHHPGEVSFPGGRREDGDRGPVATALREAAEETGLDPGGVDPLVLLPRLVLLTGHHVTAVVAHWREPVDVAAVDHGETTAVFRVPLARLADPAARLLVHHELGWSGPAFAIDGVVIWGYTSEVLDALLRLGGWERPWTAGDSVELSRAWDAARRRHR